MSNSEKPKTPGLILGSEGSLKTVPSLILEWLKDNFRLVAVLMIGATVLTNTKVTFLRVFFNPYVGAITAVSIIPALLVTIYVCESNPAERKVSIVAIFSMYILGIVFTGLAYVVNMKVQGELTAVPVIGSALFFFLVVGPLEETVKLLAGYVGAYDSRVISGPGEGAAYAAVAALGFVTAENALYIATSGLMSDGGLIPIIIERGGVGPAHIIWSSIAGYYLGMAKGGSGFRITVAVKGVALAAVLHATYNSIVTYQASVASHLDATLSVNIAPMMLNGVLIISFYAGVWGFLELLIRRHRRAYDPESEEKLEQERKTPPVREKLSALSALFGR
jgi:RsiW-degrading membrane proteinase PrsW (M82 family)